jgi:UDP-glucose 4-epimerase
VRLLLERGDDVVVLDDLATGRAERTGHARLIRADLADPAVAPTLARAMEGADAVIHLAARKQVGESVQRPLWYFQQNLGGLANLLRAVQLASVPRLVFSSSAAVYGAPNPPADAGTHSPAKLTAPPANPPPAPALPTAPPGAAAPGTPAPGTPTADAGTHSTPFTPQPIPETTPLAPINPYGQTKAAGEWLAHDVAASSDLRLACLRYFNVAGAGWADLGDPAALNLIPMVFERLTAGQPPVVFGDDYPTPDGSCIRDYVHVMDLAHAHLVALDYLDRPTRPATVFNVGTGTGASVKQVIAEAARVTGISIPPTIAPRRPGDPPALVADPSTMTQTMGWRAHRTLPDIVTSAWEAWKTR